MSLGSRLAAAALTAVLGGCAIQAGPTSEPPSRDAASRSCARATAGSAATSAAVPTEQAQAAPRIEGFSPAAVDTAGVIGVLAPLQQLSALESHAGAAPSVADELRLLRLRQRITDAILRAMLDISSVLAETDCENERGDQLKDRLQKVEERRTRRLSLGSLLVGALTAIVSGGLSLARPDAATGEVASIVGGTLEASFGAAVLFDTVSGELRTERNLLREVWESPARPGLFPSSVWRFLNRPLGADTDDLTLRDVIVAQWRAGERLGPAHSRQERERIALLFGRGGAYTVDDLNARKAMLDLLEAGISSMSQDLQLLLGELIERSQAAP